MSDYTPKRIKHFWSKVNKQGSIPVHCPELGACWEWTAYRLKKGYGAFHTKGNIKELAHRMSWQLAYGDIPEKLFVLHKCDNPSCVNPEHLFLGTNLDNMADMRIKKRSNAGEKNLMKRLTWDIVRAIRAAYATGKYNQHELGKMFNAYPSTINFIVHNKQWVE